MLNRYAQWTRENPFAWDALLVALIALVTLLLGGLQNTADWLLLVPLLVRRTHPVVMFTAVALLLAWGAATASGPSPAYAVFLVAVHAIAAYGPVWAVWAGMATGVLGAGLAVRAWWVVGSDPVEMLAAFGVICGVVAAAWFAGLLQRVRRAYILELEDRAKRIEREAAQQVQLAANEERSRIAREMHDVVAHSLSVMIVQADGALYASKNDPAAAPRALETISETGRSSLQQMRGLLGILRAEESDVQLAPVPGAVDVPALVEQVAANGLDVTLEVLGDLGRVPAATGLTVYRVVQESLTNTLKHAGPGVKAEVDLRVTTTDVRIRVDDDGRGASAVDGRGHGLRGVRERIALHTGTVEAGPRSGGGYRVSAVIPLGAA